MAESLRRGLWGNLFIAAGALVVLVAAAAWYFLPVQYEAYALLKVASSPPAVLPEGQAPAEDFDLFKRTQVQLVLSHVVLNGTLREPDMNRLSMVQEHKENPVSWLKDRLMIDFPDDAEILRIAMKGRNRGDVTEIVDKVVDVYMREIVQRDKQLRMQNEDKLRRAYESQTAEYEKELEALRMLEAIHKTSGSEAAQLRKRVAIEELDLLLTRRRDIVSRTDQNDLEILIDKARAENPKQARTADPPPPAEDSQVGPPLRVLEIKHQFLEDKLAELNEAIKQKTGDVAQLDSFSARVAAKQEELGALRAIKNQLGAKLDRATVERLAPERITVVDRAVLADGEGDAVRRNAALSVLAAAGLALLVLGLVVRLPRR